MQEEFENQIQDIIKAQQGNKEAMGELIEKNKGLIWSIVKRFQDRGYEIEDLYQIGAMGFIKCIKRFDSRFEVRLSTYAVPYILGEIKRHLRDNGPIKVSRSLKEMAIKAIEIKNEYYKKNGQEIRIEELAQKLNTTKEELALALESFRPIHSIDEQLYEESEDGESLLDKMGSNIDEENVITNKLCIEQVIQNLKEQDKQIILLRYYKGKTQSEIAKILGITQVQVSRIERKTLELMKCRLKDVG
ncbi:MAG: sigma-70 family RNA polymerase sigma factor [Clostridia bacterium]|jgi:RNA polymerase sporulation-specific sigma factor|nr:sigma-70 family RNA polymerase sigma factor [Clostridia bacterium]